MYRIFIQDLAVSFCVGVTEQERRKPQQLLISVDLSCRSDLTKLAEDLARTIDYAAVAERLTAFGSKRQWKLIETLASDLADMILSEFGPQSVSVEVKKFALPQARFVGVGVSRTRKA